jgi:ABC-2 type transport system permease protein
VLEEHVVVYPGVTYTAFLIPGLVMMSVLQNAFANSSSSLIQAKVTGSVVFILLPPISYLEFFFAYVIAAAVRGFAVGLGVLAVTWWFAPFGAAHPAWVFIFVLLGGMILGTLGIVAGIWADKFDQLAAFQNFLIMPLTMLSGVFFSIHSLPPFWQAVSRGNPVFYMIDGFRYGFFGVADTSPWIGLAVGSVCFAALSAITLRLLKRGYKLRN